MKFRTKQCKTCIFHPGQSSRAFERLLKQIEDPSMKGHYSGCRLP